LPLSTVRRGMAPHEATDDAAQLWSRCKRRDSGHSEPFAFYPANSQDSEQSGEVLNHEANAEIHAFKLLLLRMDSRLRGNDMKA